ncbi:hypothetical protein [Comamonas antarctica]|uniref:hypothetical protein n=1 Tax=Comamonas antarctica TaxID=2743470 RepID=UPI0028E689B5|nr:hypothetical protein [Comamonas antarctica]
MDLTETRIANARLAIDRAGGVGKVSTAMGYSNPSFLVQMFGPNPTRNPSEKTMRRMEKALNLPALSLDGAPAPVLPATGPGFVSAVNPEQLSDMIRLISRLADEESVKLSTEKFASLVAMAYDETTEHAGQVREGKLRQVVQLFRQ